MTHKKIQRNYTRSAPTSQSLYKIYPRITKFQEFWCEWMLFFFLNVTGQRISTAKGNKNQSKKRKQKINVCWVHWVCELRSTMRVTYCQQQQHHDEEEEEEKGKKKQTNTHTFRRFGFFLMQISIFYLLMFPKKKKESILLLLVYFPSIFTRTLFDPSSKRLSPTHTIFELLGLHV